MDWPSGYLCGDLKIHNLTPSYAELTTFFDVELIGWRRRGKGSHSSFYTNKWQATPWIDRQHWVGG